MANYFKFTVTIRDKNTMKVSAESQFKNVTEARKAVARVLLVCSDTDEVVIANIGGKLVRETYCKGDKV